MSNFDLDNVENLSSMFAGCNYLKSVIFGEFDSINLENMSYMFAGALGLTELDLSNSKNLAYIGEYAFYKSKLTNVGMKTNWISIPGIAVESPPKT